MTAPAVSSAWARSRFSGGEVVTLGKGMVVNGATEAVRTCPGRFWIVGG